MLQLFWKCCRLPLIKKTATTKCFHEERTDTLETSTKVARFSKGMRYTKNILRGNLELKDVI